MKKLNIAHSLKNQRGINMVDLMMWLVIAALLLAAALQGIGYYQKAAYLNNMKSDAFNAGTNSLAVAANDGSLTKGVVTTGTSETKWSEGVSYSVEGTDASPYIRVSNPSVADQEVIYIFASCADYPVGVNVVPTGGTLALEGCGISASPPAEGSGGSGETPQFGAESDTKVAYTPLDRNQLGPGHAETTFNYFAAELDWSALKSQVEYYASSSPEFQTAYENSSDPENVAKKAAEPWSYKAGLEANIKYSNARTLNDPVLQDKYSAFNSANGAMWGDPNDTTHRASTAALRDYYAYAISTNITTDKMVPSPSNPSSFVNKTVAAGTNTPVTIDYATPDVLNVAGKKNEFWGHAEAVTQQGGSSLLSWSTNHAELDAAPVDGQKVLLTATFTPNTNSGNWEPGVYEVAVGANHHAAGLVHYSIFTITVE